MRRRLIAVIALFITVWTSPVVAAEILQSPSSWKFKNQEEWLVSQIVHDMAEMVLFAAAAKQGKAFDPKSLQFGCTQVDQPAEKYSVTLESPELPKKFTCDFQFEKCIYETQTYANIGAALLKELQLTAETDNSAVDSSELLKQLSDNSMGALHEQNNLVSKAITDHPLSPATQEQAALVYCTFNLLDMCRSFYDYRFGDARAVAHIALARALRNTEPLGFTGKLAEAAVCGMSSRDTETVERSEQLLKEAHGPIETSWARTLKLIGTNDPRVFDKDNFTPLEEYQYLMRVAFFMGSDKVVDYMTEMHVRPNIQWLRLINNNDTSVGNGHAFTAPWFAAELSDYAKDAYLWKHEELKSWTNVSDQLNLEPTRCLIADGDKTSLKVISWPDVASWHQRQIFGAFLSSHYFQAHMYGVKENADELLKLAESTLSGARLYPFIYGFVESDKMPTHIANAMKVIDEAPYLVPFSAWGTLAEDDKSNKVKGALRAWAGDLPLFGTAYDFYEYAYVLESPKLDVATLSHLRDIAIYNRYVCQKYVKKKYGEKPTGDQWTEGYGKMVEFDKEARAAVAFAEPNKPEVFIPRVAKYASEDSPYELFDLAYYCWSRGRPADTWKYYKLAMESEADSIGKANKTWHWAKHLYETGHKKEADAAADFAAEVYSHNGLLAKSKLCELEKNYKCAEDYAKKIAERYDNSVALSTFYIRNRKRSPAYEKLAQKAISKDFPRGLVVENPATGSTPPEFGAAVSYVDEFGDRLGIKKDFVLTGMNGYVLHNAKDVDAIGELTWSDHMRLTYWDGKQYKKVASPCLYLKPDWGVTDYKKGANKDAK